MKKYEVTKTLASATSQMWDAGDMLSRIALGIPLPEGWSKEAALELIKASFDKWLSTGKRKQTWENQMRQCQLDPKLLKGHSAN